LNVTEQQSVCDLNNQPGSSSANNQPVVSSLKTAEMNMRLKSGCGSTNDSDERLREIDELIDTIRGSLVGDLHPNIIAVAKKGLKTVVAQITATRQQPIVNPEPLPIPQISNEPGNKKLEKQFRFQTTKVKSRSRNQLSLKKPSLAEKSTIVRALEGKEILVSRTSSGEDHSYEKDCRQQFEHSYNKVPDTTITKRRRLSISLQRPIRRIQFPHISVLFSNYIRRNGMVLLIMITL